MHVEVVRSKKRRKTVELRPTPEGVRISIPHDATKEEEERYIERLLRRYERREQMKEIDLEERSQRLARNYKLLTPQNIRWVENQQSRWGSCTPSTGEIRISSQVAKFPKWVLDYVIVHELAHLRYAGHGPRFWSLVYRYPKTERARGFLIAKGLETGEDENENENEESLPETNWEARQPPLDFTGEDYSSSSNSD